MTRHALRPSGIAIILATLMALARPAAAASPDEQARDLFLAQRYAEALVIYQRLRTESHHPTYLRNIGRCHQMMRQPAPAIAAFESYLREAPGLPASERAEIEGYIAEMRRLEASQTPAAAVPPASTPVLSPSPPPETNTPLVAAAAAPATAGDGSADTSILRKWWFWAGVGALVVAGGVILAVSASGDDKRLPCPTGAVCP